MAVQLRTMTTDQLNALKTQIAQEETLRKAEIPKIYGKWFTDIVGVDTIYRLNIVEAQEVNLQNAEKYPRDVVRPALLKEHSALRGRMGDNRPFIAVKVEIADSTTNKVLGVVVELIFKRYSGDGAVKENNYVTALSNMTDDNKRFESCLYSGGGMSNNQLAALKDLLDGQQIVSPLLPEYLIRMAK